MQEAFLFFIRLFCLSVLFSAAAVRGVPAAGWGEAEIPVPVESGAWGESEPFEVAGLFSADKEETPEKLPPWLDNAAAVADVEDGTPMIALVIDDLGVNKKMTAEVIRLPAPLTASFLYYADDLPRQTAAAAAAGHELLVHTPMQPVNSRFDAGPNALRIGMSDAEITENLNLMLESFSGYVGINNHMGSLFSADEHAMRTVMRTVAERGLLFLDSLTSNKSVGGKAARETGVPYAVRNVFLDNTRNENEILKQLDLLERHARRHRFAVGIGHPHKSTVGALKKWIPAAKKRGVAFVPVSLIAVYVQDGETAANGRALNPHDENE